MLAHSIKRLPNSAGTISVRGNYGTIFVRKHLIVASKYDDNDDYEASIRMITKINHMTIGIAKKDVTEYDDHYNGKM